jgi:hypothetical protein
MKNSLRTLGAAAALLCIASASAAAQNNSDQISIGVSTAAVGGAYSPNNAGNNTVTQVNAGSVGAEVRALNAAGGENAVVGGVIGGGSSAVLGGQLTGGGAPAAQTGALMSALGNLGANPSPAALSAAIQAFNALVAAVPQGMVANPPPALAAIRQALISIRAGK